MGNENKKLPYKAEIRELFVFVGYNIIAKLKAVTHHSLPFTHHCLKLMPGSGNILHIPHDDEGLSCLKHTRRQGVELNFFIFAP